MTQNWNQQSHDTLSRAWVPEVALVQRVSFSATIVFLSDHCVLSGVLLRAAIRAKTFRESARRQVP